MEMVFVPMWNGGSEPDLGLLSIPTNARIRHLVVTHVLPEGATSLDQELKGHNIYWELEGD